MNSFDEQLRDRLNALSADVANLDPPGPDAARRRAAQRTRNQITGVVLGAAAVAVLGVIGVTQDQLFTAPEPAEPTETETPTTVPTPPDEDDTNTDNPQPPPDDNVNLDNAFITLEEMGNENGAGSPIEWGLSDTAESPYDCAPAAPEGTKHVSYESTASGHFMQFVEVSDDPVSRFSEIRADVESCVRDLPVEGANRDGQMVDAWAVAGLGDEAWMATYWSPRTELADGMEEDLVSVRLVRTGNYISTLTEGSPANETHNGPMSTDDSETAAQRLCEAIGQECVGKPELTRLYPEPVGDLNGWLTVDDIVTATGLDSIGEGGEVRDADETEDTPPGWNLVHLPRAPAADGATSFQSRIYSDPAGEPGGVELTQEMAVFPDDETAREHYDALVEGIDDTIEEGTTLDNAGTLDVDGAAGTAWRAETPEYQTTFVFGVVVQGHTVTALIYLTFPDADITSDQMLDLLARAAERLATS